MSGAELAPAIQLDLNQELYLESVAESDIVEDATVATEVTSLDHVGDTYVLEGAVLFSGVLRKQVPTESGETTLELSHRLPFKLRVPSKTQPRGIVNVASRISSWHLQVNGDHWLQIEADLQVSGLNGRHGFHFQCGSQEFGSLPGASSASVSKPEQEAAPAEPLTADVAETPPADEETTTESAVDDPDAFTASAVPDADEDANSDTRELADVEVASYQDDGFAKRELVDFDRALDGSAESNQLEESLLRSADSETSGVNASADSELVSADMARSTEDALATFEFEHQVSANEESEANFTTPIPNQPLASDIPFSAARSFSDAGFAPHAGFHSARELTRESAPAQPSIESVNAPGDAVESTGPAVQLTRSDQGDSFNTAYSQPQENLWSFVDFNQPERAFTLRYVVVMEDETLHTVAERLGCRVTDLVTLNHLQVEEVAVGQTLRVPSSVVPLTPR